MADDERPPTAEEKFAPKLPRQLQQQVDAVNAAMAQPSPGEPPKEALPEGEYEEQPEGEEPEDEQPQLLDDDEPPSWEQRARSAEGRLDQALNANQLLARRMGELERDMNLLKLRGAEPETPPVPKAKPQYVKPEEINDYGDEFFDVVGRKAREEFVPVVDELSERLKRLESGQQAVGKVVEQTQKRGLYDALRDEVPEWATINHHPAFHNWLSIPDPYSGRQRHEMLKEAFSRHDADRVVNFFRGFLSEATGTPQTRGPAQPTPPNGGGTTGRPSLEDFAAPGRARSAPQELPPDKPVYTHAWIAKFMADKRTGKYRGREAEADAVERDIYQAQHEGRIQ